MGSSASIRDLFLTCSERAADLIADGAVSDRWDEPSVLAGYTVGGLCGHLSRAVTTVADYLDRSPPDERVERLDAAEYFATVLGDADPVDSKLHVSIRRRSQEAADAGPQALAATMRDTTRQLGERLDAGTLARPVQVRDGIVMTPEEYLRTRLVELVVHLDDLLVSVDAADAQRVPDAAYVEVAGVLGRLAALRVGGLPVVRSLARRERHEPAVRAF